MFPTRTFHCLFIFMLLSIATIARTTDAASPIYNPRRFILPNDDDDEIQRDLINDLLQREYADRYRDYLEKSLIAQSKDDLGGMTEQHVGFFPPGKRGQTFVRFGKRSVHPVN